MDIIFKLPARLDTISAPGVEREIEPLVAENNYVIFDFSDCVYMASMGMRILTKVKKTLMSKRGELYLSNVDSTILGVLKMAGMTSFLKIVPSNEEALGLIRTLGEESAGCFDFETNGHAFSFVQKGGELEMVRWDALTLAGYDELGFAAGNGASADGLEADPERFADFIATGNCLSLGDDYRITAEPSKTGVYLSQAYSFGCVPSGVFEPCVSKNLPLATMAEAAFVLKKEHFVGSLERAFLVFIDAGGEHPSVSFLCCTEGVHLAGEDIVGASYSLGEWRQGDPLVDFSSLISNNLTIDNILEVSALNLDRVLASPICAAFFVSSQVSFRDVRMVVESSGEEKLELYKEFLARRIYTDSSKISLKRLSGGFSAQTYQVESFDGEGRRLRPTVMKVACSDMIERESRRCIENAMPYIMNNSAQILGTEYFAEVGVLRYNFVGIGGQDSHLRWLRDYYFRDSFEQLSPLFDKIFLQILHPWYGQTVPRGLDLYAEHDPTVTFFPHIYDVARETLGVDCSKQHIYVEELGREMLNSYWFLKNEYPRRKGCKYDYYAAICHGDLNMQNILVDEKENIFLIDFSETKTRCAVSDFARLEVIMMVDNSPCTTEEDYRAYCKFVLPIYEGFDSIDPEKMADSSYFGAHSELVHKNQMLTRKMREYACRCIGDSAKGEDGAYPYYFPWLEWCLPVVAYSGLSLYTRRLSMILSGLICEKLWNRG